MGIHTGPKDGDYARYVEVLTSGSQGEPGKVYTSRKAAPAGWTIESEMPPLPDGFKPAPVAINPMVTPGAGPAANITTHPGQEQNAEMTLAARSAKRTTSIVFRLIAIVLFVMGANLVVGALADDMSSGEDVIPGVFLLFFALILFKAASGLKRDASRPGKALPPMSVKAQRR